MRRDAASVTDYLAGLPAEHAADLGVVVALARARLPEAIESVEYGMPTWKAPSGEMLMAVAAQKNNLALYICPALGEYVYAGWREKLPKSAIGKGCLRFKRLDGLPDGMVEALVGRVAAGT